MFIIPFPDGSKIRSLSPEQARLVNSLWHYNNGVHSEPYIKELISKLPSSCLYNSEGSVVGYTLAYHYGYLGFYHVLRERERNGFSQVIGSHFLSLCLQQAVMHIHINETNASTMRFAELTGFDVDQNIYFVKALDSKKR